MPIAGIGTDIVEIERFADRLLRTPRLVERILTDSEREIYAAHSQPHRYLAKRFAVKEAAVKALGTGIGRGISWQQINVSNDEHGAPFLTFSGEFLARCQAKGIVRSHVSISDEQHYAVATVILEIA